MTITRSITISRKGIENMAIDFNDLKAIRQAAQDRPPEGPEKPPKPSFIIDHNNTFREPETPQEKPRKERKPATRRKAAPATRNQVNEDLINRIMDGIQLRESPEELLILATYAIWQLTDNANVWAALLSNKADLYGMSSTEIKKLTAPYQVKPILDQIDIEQKEGK